MLSSQAIEIGAGEEKPVGALARDLRGDPVALARAAFAGMTLVESRDRGDRGRRAVGPHQVDGVGAQRDHRPALPGNGLGQTIPLRAAHEERIEAEAAALWQLLLEPSARRMLGDVPALEQRLVDLRRDLHGIAPVREDRGLLHQHEDLGRRSGESGQPGDALGVVRKVLAAVLVGAGQEEAVDALLLEPMPERPQPLGPRRAHFRGAITMTIWRPSSRGNCSTLARSAISSRTLFRIPMAIS